MTLTDPPEPPATPGTTVTHVAGMQMVVGTQLRQRCSWCGAVLEDVDLSKIGAQVPDPGSYGPQEAAEAALAYPTWEPGLLVRTDGGMRIGIEGDDLPDDACARLPHDLTGAVAPPGT